MYYSICFVHADDVLYEAKIYYLNKHHISVVLYGWTLTSDLVKRPLEGAIKSVFH